MACSTRRRKGVGVGFPPRLAESAEGSAEKRIPLGFLREDRIGAAMFRVLIADRNPHVREYLRRELSRIDLPVEVAEDGRELLRRIATRPEIDLLVLDPDLPFLEERALARRLRARMPPLAVVLHSFGAERGDWPSLWRRLPLVEKGGDSVERLRAAIAGARRDRDA